MGKGEGPYLTEFDYKYGPYYTLMRNSTEESGLSDPCNQQLSCLERPTSGAKL
jgi:hypothetical protein